MILKETGPTLRAKEANNDAAFSECMVNTFRREGSENLDQHKVGLRGDGSEPRELLKIRMRCPRRMK